VVSLSVTLGRRSSRAVELVIGVAVGLIIADLLMLLIGTGPAQIGVVVLLAMAAAVAIGGGQLLVNQAAISALLVVVLQAPEATFDPSRLLDALVGSATALAINYLLPVDPERLVERAARPVFEELAGILEEIAAALEEADPAQAGRALSRARELDGWVNSFTEALAAGQETARLSPTRRRALGHLGLYATAGARIDLTVINGRILARGASNVVRRGRPASPVMPEAVRDLKRAVLALSSYLEESEGAEEARRHALEAAEKATRALEESHNLALSMLVGQVRTAAVDILRSTGMDQESAVQALEDAAGRATDL
jgi:uncharacterized membrane protein YccC